MRSDARAMMNDKGRLYSDAMMTCAQMREDARANDDRKGGTSPR